MTLPPLPLPKGKAPPMPPLPTTEPRKLPPTPLLGASAPPMDEDGFLAAMDEAEAITTRLREELKLSRATAIVYRLGGRCYAVDHLEWAQRRDPSHPEHLLEAEIAAVVSRGREI